MNFSIDPKDLNLQDAAGMQLVEVIRNLAEESGTTDYEDLENLPKINGVKLVGDKSSDDLHIAVSDEQVTEAVDAWLEDNVDPETGYVLDSTLTMSNAAAPADKVGELKNTFMPFSSVNSYNGNYSYGYVNQATGSWEASTASGSYAGTEEYIPVNGPLFCLALYNWGAATSIALRYALYNADKEYISGAIITDNTTYSKDAQGTPYLSFDNANVKFIRFSATKATFTAGLIKITVESSPIPVGYSMYSAPLVQKSNSIAPLVGSTVYGGKGVQVSGTNLIANDVISIKENSLRKNKMYHFHGTFSTFGVVECGHGTGDYSMYFQITETQIKILSNGVVGTTLDHDLSLTDYFDFIVQVGDEKLGKIILNTNGGTYEKDVQIVQGYKGTIYLKSNSGTLTTAYISFSCKDFKSPIWMFGDSYFTHTSDKRWPYYLIDYGYGLPLLDAFPGASSADIFPHFMTFLAHYGCPKFAVWCLGMNDPDTDSVNATWAKYAQQFADTCAKFGITPVFATIPNTPSVTNYYKNQWVKNSGYRYIDFAKAVNAESIGATWYSDTREDDVHPNENGAKMLALQVLYDLPEVTL